MAKILIVADAGDDSAKRVRAFEQDGFEVCFTAGLLGAALLAEKAIFDLILIASRLATGLALETVFGYRGERVIGYHNEEIEVGIFPLSVETRGLFSCGNFLKMIRCDNY